VEVGAGGGVISFPFREKRGNEWLSKPLFVCLFETETTYVSQSDLELETLLEQPLENWDYSPEPW
jgi:hypothetical protein